LKARTVAAGLPFYSAHPIHSDIRVPNVIVSADTVVALDGRILGKPRDPAEATHMLKLLRRQAHAVYSGLTVAYCEWDLTPPDQGWQFITHLHQSKVWMRPYSDTEITDYVAGGSPLDKAGAYGIQDRPFAPVERLDGCFASVMGLPLGELAAALKSINLALPDVAPLCTGITDTSCCQAS
jgi:septum formation protein